VPGRVFTETERTRLGAFPSEISEPDLIRYFTLSVSDLEFVRQQRGDHIAWALPYSYARYVTWGSAPMILPPFRRRPSPSWPISSRSLPGRFMPMGRDLRLGRGFCNRFNPTWDFTTQRARTYGRWPTGYWRAPWHDKSGLLFQLACEHLRAEKIVRPDVTRLERLASSCSICVARFSSSAHRAHELGFATTH
jgi:hypothetical protein